MIYQNGKAISMSRNSSEEFYSIEETIIGTWIDGKPLYRRVIIGTTAESNGAFRLTELPNTVTVWNIYGILLAKDGARVPLTLYYQTNTHICAYIYTENSSNYIIVGMQHAGDAYLSCPIYAVIEYTKTTDQATIELPAMLSVKPSAANVSSVKEVTTSMPNIMQAQGSSAAIL